MGREETNLLFGAAAIRQNPLKIEAESNGATLPNKRRPRLVVCGRIGGVVTVRAQSRTTSGYAHRRCAGPQFALRARVGRQRYATDLAG